MTRNFCYQNKNCHFSFTGLLVTFHRLIDRLVSSDETTTTMKRSITLTDGSIRRVLDANTIADICAALQHSISFQLEDRIKRALIYLKTREVDIEHVVVSGGVASNKFLRSKYNIIICIFINLKI